MSASSPLRLALPPLPERTERWALFLDLDGTLAPIVAHPDLVQLEPELRGLLARLADRLDGALCILSGRPLHQLEALLPDEQGLCLVGSHGAEGRCLPETGVPAPALTSLGAEVEREIEGLHGVWVETKPGGFAVHFRARPEAAGCVRRLLVRHLSAHPGLRALEGDCVAEVLAEGRDKGTALVSLAGSRRFRGRVPVVLGDDITDEDAFAAADTLSGFGVRVGLRRPTRARYGLPCVTLAHTWLEALADRLEGS